MLRDVGVPVEFKDMLIHDVTYFKLISRLPADYLEGFVVQRRRCLPIDDFRYPSSLGGPTL